MVSLYQWGLEGHNWRPPVKKGRKAHFKFRDKASRHFVREENFRASIITQVGQYGRYYCAQLICAKQFRACVGAIFFRENINASYCPSLPEPFNWLGRDRQHCRSRHWSLEITTTWYVSRIEESACPWIACTKHNIIHIWYIRPGKSVKMLSCMMHSMYWFSLNICIIARVDNSNIQVIRINHT